MRHTITISLSADETLLPLKVSDIRDSIARMISEDYSVHYDQHGYEDESALVSTINVDGYIWNHERGCFDEQYGIDEEAREHLLNGRKIHAIKRIREITNLGLGEAKAIADNWKP